MHTFFRIYVGDNSDDLGSLKVVLEQTLDDSRQQNDPLPLQLFNFSSTATGRFIGFELLEWHGGQGGGLQYFDIQRCGNGEFNVVLI